MKSMKNLVTIMDGSNGSGYLYAITKNDTIIQCMFSNKRITTNKQLNGMYNYQKRVDNREKLHRRKYGRKER